MLRNSDFGLRTSACAGPRALFIINPAAGANRAQARWAAFEPHLRKNGIQAERVFTSSPIETTDLARKAAPDHDLLVAVGGDGTVSDVAHGILSSQATCTSLAIVPFGTGNDLAKVLGIRSDADAIRSFTSGPANTIDVLQVHCQRNGRATLRYALLFAGVGIISAALKQTTHELKRVLGQRLAYPAGLLRALWAYHSPLMSVTCDEQVLQRRFLYVGASNTAIAGGGMKIAPDAKIDDGLLNVNLVEAVGRWGALLQLRRVCRGRHTGHPHVRYLTARRLEIVAPADLEVAADGDLIGYTPARVLVQPKALRVFVPPKIGN
jgi:diacylglycerol kinase (ATP)